MHWKTEITEPGFYWIRATPADVPRVFEVVADLDDSGWLVLMSGPWKPTDLDGFEYWGPIPAPPQAFS